MLAEKPLAGKRIVVTRAPEQAQASVHELERLGAEVILLPVVAFEAPWIPGRSTVLLANFRRSIGFCSPVRMRYDSFRAALTSSA